MNLSNNTVIQVYLPALVGYVPSALLKCLSAFLDFCYLARRPSFNEDTMASLQDALDSFHQHREIFRTSGVRPTGFSLPRQHSLTHYLTLIPDFGAPGGLCSSITESWHITAVKKPWRRSNRYQALGQMLITNQCLDKLSSMRANYEARGMTILPTIEEDDDAAEDKDEGGPVDELVEGNVTLARHRGICGFIMPNSSG